VNIVYGGRLVGGQFSASAEVSGYGLFALDDLPPIPPEQRQLLDLVGA